jgi:GH18 family chitinase
MLYGALFVISYLSHSLIDFSLVSVLFLADIPFEGVDYLVYAFANLTVDSHCYLNDPWADTDKPMPSNCEAGGPLQTWSDSPKGNIGQLNCLRKKHPSLKVILSVGGPSFFFSAVLFILLFLCELPF